MVKHSLNKLLVLLGLLALFWSYPVAAESYSDLYIKITDATTAVQNKDQAKAKELVGEIKNDFETKENHDSKAGKKVSKALDIKGDVTEEDLTSISSALLKFEKEQNPVDLDAEKEKLETRLNPYFKNLQDAITAKDLAATRKTYSELNNAWTRNEAVVRDHSTAYYGKIETAISLLRSSIETEPTDFTSIQSSYDDLKGGIDDFIKGVPLDNTSSSLTLKDGIKLLEEALGQFQSGDEKTAAATMKKFITIWPTIEGDVSTTNPSLYTRVESETPVIMVKGKEKAYQAKLQALITDLSAIDTSASYNAFDAMLILLREGVEALLIVMALVTTLKAAKMRKGLKWVYGGAIAGVLASAVIAVILQVVFPAVTSGANREIIEGGVGIFAVAMMILIGIWLHSKSSVKQWNDFMDRQMTPGMNTMVTISYRTEQTNTLSVPTGAILQKEGKAYVFVFNPSDNTVHKQEISMLRLLNNGHSLITAGQLKPGELIVSSGVHHIEDGETVKPLPLVTNTNIGGLL